VKRLCADDSAGSRVKVGHRQALTASSTPSISMLGVSLCANTFCKHYCSYSSKTLDGAGHVIQGAAACEPRSRTSRRSFVSACHSRTGQVAEGGGHGLLRLPRGAHEFPGTGGVRPSRPNNWRRWLQRRSQKAGVTWAWMDKLAAAWLPLPRVLHPWPTERFAVKHPRWEPSA
jgi:hypothetical protein